MKLLKFPIILCCLFLILGITLGKYTNFNTYWLLVTFGFLLIVLIIMLVVYRNKRLKTIWFGLTACSLMVILGMLVFYFHNPSHNPQHYLHHAKADSIAPFTLRIKRTLKPSLYQHKYYAEVLKHNQTTVFGTMLLNVSKDSLTEKLAVGDLVVLKNKVSEINTPKNPFQFDYKNYLENQYVFLQLHSDYNQLLHLPKQAHSFYSYADELRSHMQHKLKYYGLQGDEFAIVNALLLGQRQDISEEVYNNFAAAGAIHILAVSGLHVGVILLLINWLLQPLNYIKRGTIIRTILVILFLWSFAVVAGLSPSVCRAVTMFTAVAIAINFKRANNIYNTLAVSAFLLLLFKPTFLFEIGFQMSYLAVLGIVSIQPLIYNYWKPKYRIVDKFWSLFTVTLAAQLGVLPLSLFYFHQFPALFLVSNLVIIPLMGIILGTGLLLILLASLDWMHSFIMQLYANIIATLNNFIAWIANAETFFIQDIPFNLWQMLAFYLLIFFVFSTLKYRNSYHLKWLLSAIIVLQLAFISTDYRNADSEFVIFQKNRHSLFGIKQQHEMVLHGNFDSISLKTDHTIRDYKVGNHLKHVTTDSIDNILQFKNQLILVVDSFGIYNVSFKPEIVVLRNSPKINLNRLIDSLQPQQIIADGSNYKSYVLRWKATCNTKKLPFHHTYEMGAFILKD